MSLRREFWEQHVFIIKEGVLGDACVYYGRSFGSSSCSFRREFWEQHVLIVTEGVLEHAFITEGVRKVHVFITKVV